MHGPRKYDHGARLAILRAASLYNGSYSIARGSGGDGRRHWRRTRGTQPAFYPAAWESKRVHGNLEGDFRLRRRILLVASACSAGATRLKHVQLSSFLTPTVCTPTQRTSPYTCTHIGFVGRNSNEHMVAEDINALILIQPHPTDYGSAAPCCLHVSCSDASASCDA